MLPNWEFSWVSHLENVDCVGEMAYACAVNAVVDPTELFQRSGYHVIDTSLVGGVDFYCCCFKIGMRGEIPGLFGSSLSTFFIDVCKNNTSRSSLSKGNGCFFANAASRLRAPGQKAFILAWAKLLSPVTSATPPNGITVAMLVQKPGGLRIDKFYCC